MNQIRNIHEIIQPLLLSVNPHTLFQHGQKDKKIPHLFFSPPLPALITQHLPFYLSIYYPHLLHHFHLFSSFSLTLLSLKPRLSFSPHLTLLFLLSFFTLLLTFSNSILLILIISFIHFINQLIINFLHFIELHSRLLIIQPLIRQYFLDFLTDFLTDFLEFILNSIILVLLVITIHSYI